MGDNYVNEFQDWYLGRLEQISKTEKGLKNACEYLRGKLVIENSHPFELELVGKIIEVKEKEQYKKNCLLRSALSKFLLVLLNLENNKTTFITCEYNETIDSFIKSEYIENILKKELSLEENKTLKDMDLKEIFALVEKQTDHYKVELLKLYLLKIGNKEVKEFIKIK